MSFQAKRELLAQVAPRYREATCAQKRLMLDEFVAITGYVRKYAIRLLGRRVVGGPAPIARPRAPRYGPAVVEALAVAWAATNYVCAKRLVPFLPELVPTLERYGHLQLSDADRRGLLQVSPATADRLLRPVRQRDQPRGIGTTKAGRLLKHQVPVRTFAEWNDIRPGFMEADSVAHCGTVAEGSFLSTLVLTDVATGWTECLPLLHRTHDAVIRALDQAQRLLPFPLLGLDTDNGGEFLNYPLLAYCAREQITFTRGRTYRSNDQCYVEQKNGSVVRQLVGYDRLDGARAYRQLAELYRAVRLYVNFFQPSLKLRYKHREGRHLLRQYAPAQTPFQRLLAANLLDATSCTRLTSFYTALDPVRLLRQLSVLQDALWRHAVVLQPTEPRAHTCFSLGLCSPSAAPETPVDAFSRLTQSSYTRKYRRTEKSRGPRAYRTRPDPFSGEWQGIEAMIAVAPERTAVSIFAELQARAPARHPDGQLRTLQRRIADWRTKVLLAFDDGWLAEDGIWSSRPGRLHAEVEGAHLQQALP